MTATVIVDKSVRRDMNTLNLNLGMRLGADLRRKVPGKRVVALRMKRADGRFCRVFCGNSFCLKRLFGLA